MDKLYEIQIKMYAFLMDRRGDMAEKAVVMALVLLAAYAAFRLLGGNISDLVNAIANKISGG
jgi:hypothetical protein